jgi:hypothetical protein
MESDACKGLAGIAEKSIWNVPDAASQEARFNLLRETLQKHKEPDPSDLYGLGKPLATALKDQVSNFTSSDWSSLVKNMNDCSQSRRGADAFQFSEVPRGER